MITTRACSRRSARSRSGRSHLVNDLFAGQYHSVFKGRGMEFDEVREYQPGDDVRTIDWNVTARTGAPLVKTLRRGARADGDAARRRERVDALRQPVRQTEARARRRARARCSPSRRSRNNDKVGLIIFTDRVELCVPPRKGTQHVLRVIREILYFEPQGRGTDLGARSTGSIESRTGAAWCSDLRFLTEDPGRKLAVSARRHDLVALVVEDPRERDLVPIGMV